ncbi:MAG: sigma-E processing peptidase SpoIIGA [Firmicutes bacterium]|nr:sigma-E processing peptidase SpoIIGA [Bacillota bacterium]
MTIFVEYAIIDNLVVNSMLLFFMFRNIRGKMYLRKVILCVAVGIVFAIVVPVLSMGLLLYFEPRNFATAMAMLMSVKIFTTVLFVFMMSKLIKYMTKKHMVSNMIRDIVITYKDESFKAKSYIDTGNRLVDPESGAPVVIITISLFLKIFPDIPADRIVMNRLEKENITEGRYIDFATVGKSSKMFVFAPSKIEVLGETKTVHENVRLGLSMKGFRDVVKYDALLNSSFV